jgi:hypothetical protein
MGPTLIGVALVLSCIAFLMDMGRSPAVRMRCAAYGWFVLLGGMMLPPLARVRAERIDTTASRL